MLGMIIGISSVIAIVTIGDTMRSVISKEYEGIGLGRAICYVLKFDGNYYYSESFTEDQVEQIMDVFGDDIEYYSYAASGKIQGTNGRRTKEIMATGVRGGYEKVQTVDMISGRMISQRDFENDKKVIVLEEQTAIDLFGTADVTGKTIRAKYSNGNQDEVEDLNIVGVYKDSTSVFMKLLNGSDNSRGKAYVPEKMMDDGSNGVWNLDMFVSDQAGEDFQNKFTRYVAKLMNVELEDVMYSSAKEEMSAMDSVMSGLSMAVGAIAAISLLVGGIGIMNIMLVSVTERTREIGIRKALGARTRDILMQFLIESAIISAAGGCIGTLLGGGGIMIVGLAFGIDVVLKPAVVMTAVIFSAFVGMFFGMYPAKKAASANPIEALRYE